MAMPALEKSTWNFNCNNTYSDPVAETRVNQAIWAIKNQLVSWGWTVKGSSDSTTAGMDSVDRWDGYTKIVHNSGAHSWIVLTNTALNAYFELLLDFKYSSAPGSMNLSVAFASPGFTGGSTTDIPTSPTASKSFISGGWVNTSYNIVVHMMESSDDECTRILIAQNNTANNLWLFDKVNSPHSGWTSSLANVSVVLASTTPANVATYANLNDAANFDGYVNDAICTMYCTTEGFGTAALGEQWTFVSELNNGYPVTPIGLFSSSIGYRISGGRLYDIYFGSNSGINSGDTYPSGGYAWIQWGHIILPWNSTTPVMS